MIFIKPAGMPMIFIKPAVLGLRTCNYHQNAYARLRNQDLLTLEKQYDSMTQLLYYTHERRFWTLLDGDHPKII